MKNAILILLFSFFINGYIAAQICVNQENNVGINHPNPNNTKLSVINNTERYTIKAKYDDNIAGLEYITGFQNEININSTTIPFGVNNRFTISANAQNSVYGFYNHITADHPGQVYGMKNDLISSGTGVRQAIATYITALPNSGVVYGMVNGIDKENNATSYGYNVNTNMHGGSGGTAFGVRSSINKDQGLNSSEINGINANANMYAIYGSIDSDLDGYAAYFQGRTYANGSNFRSSDISLKKDIQDLSSSMSVIRLLQPKQYKLKNCKFDPDRLTYGFIAQDVEKILPDLVISVNQPGERQKVILKKEETITNEDGTKTTIPEEVEMVQNMDGKPLLAINYDGILPIVVDGLQEQDEKICTNSNDIQKLEARIKQLENDLINSNENCKALLEQISKLTQTSGL